MGKGLDQEKPDFSPINGDVIDGSPTKGLGIDMNPDGRPLAAPVAFPRCVKA